MVTGLRVERRGLTGYLRRLRQRTLETARDSGLRGVGWRVVARAYRQGVRPLLPRVGPVRYAGVPVAFFRKWGDRALPELCRPHDVNDLPDYEAGLVAALQRYVEAGDRVVVVGGGVGLTATVAALKAGGTGSVECFEGGRENVKLVGATARLNEVAERVRVHHAIVGRSVAIYGTEPRSRIVPAADLPECDILELDCEGAEVDILREMTIRPRVVIVETHGWYEAPSSRIRGLLEERGYTVEDFGVAEPRFREYCEEHDIRVLAGRRMGS